jgi:hypothetical protein
MGGVAAIMVGSVHYVSEYLGSEYVRTHLGVWVEQKFWPSISLVQGKAAQAEWAMIENTKRGARWRKNPFHYPECMACLSLGRW